ncbi:hypothetical protein [Georgenia sp. SUBG003]|uniref:hypothetical protein n=1 Tax=Georgenia sp. SUBG003 TaxID=1497974 RepID=UPI003AB2A023
MNRAGADPFGTAALREAALTIWRRDPSRLRQDANLEEDHARGYYRDRVVVELAQRSGGPAGTGVPIAHRRVRGRGRPGTPLRVT